MTTTDSSEAGEDTELGRTEASITSSPNEPADEHQAPTKPSRTSLPDDDPIRAKLVENVKDALRALPIYFQSASAIEGLEAGDLFSLNSVLGGTIEVQTIATLNRIRKVWDPDDEWAEYGFERSSQTFPDVRLVSRTPGRTSPILGIELKGWYLLSREGEPSARYTATAEACSPYDLLVIVPWRLSNVLAGVPLVYEPFIEQARYASEMRNYYWTVGRGARGDTGIRIPTGVTPYPTPKTKTSDRAVADSGNFGRVARIQGFMEDYCAQMLSTPVSGIEAKHWLNFFKTYLDGAARDDVDAAIGRAFSKIRKPNESARETALADALRSLGNLLAGDAIEESR